MTLLKVLYRTSVTREWGMDFPLPPLPSSPSAFICVMVILKAFTLLQSIGTRPVSTFQSCLDVYEFVTTSPTPVRNYGNA
jgi:hypothetical protein